MGRGALITATRPMRALVQICLLTSLITGCLPTRPPLACTEFIDSEEKLAHLQPLAIAPANEYSAAHSPWRVEAYLGNQLARRVSWDEALRCYCRARLLAPQGDTEVHDQLAFDQMLCHFFANRPEEVLRVFETSNLPRVQRTFAPFGDLLVMLYDSYQRVGAEMGSASGEHALVTLKLLGEIDVRRAALVSLRALVQERDISQLEVRAGDDEALSHLGPLMGTVRARLRDPKRAMALNALLPGAGYWYVGQRQTAITSFALNLLFGAAAWHSLNHGDAALGLIALSFEFGWYFGGIQGAKLAAEEYNRRQFDPIGEKILQEGGARKAQLIEFGF